MSRALQYYIRMLQDETRNKAYADAIARAVQPGMVVADIGTGQGLLAMMAAKAGAKKVYAIERVPESQALAKHLIARNGFADRIEVVEDHAEKVVLPEPVDLVISEILGNMGIDEGIHPAYTGFLANNPHDASGATPRVLPKRVKMYLQPLMLTDAFLGAWRTTIDGLDFSPALEISTENLTTSIDLRRPQRPLAPPVLLEEVAPGITPDPHPESWTAEFTIDRDGALDGFWGFFEAELVDGIWVDNKCRQDCSWFHFFKPCQPPVPVQKGQRITATLDRLGATHHHGWDVTWIPQDEKTEEQPAA
ncbi:MAG: 50S ribosomal protein L11 methyltransferase [Alphaproteobacteria bacterium]|nr:50S ribosomal protein L11 methyltransferase [Alphaproteobacteria bacterium]